MTNSIERRIKSVLDTNLLKLDGSVSFCNAMRDGIASKQVGWDIPGDFVWNQ